MFSMVASALALTLLAARGDRPVPAGMARIPAGTFAPLYAPPMRVEGFAIDRLPVTRGEFASFLRTHAEWRRTAVDARAADETYLADWRGDLAPGSDADFRRPVVNVSWFAARAYCESKGKRLPTTAEWERAAAASKTRGDASDDPAFIAHVLSLYTMRGTAPVGGVGRSQPNLFGVFDLHELVWEWTADFDGRRSVPNAAAHSHHAVTPTHDAHGSCASAAIGATRTDNYPAFLRNAVRAGLDRTSATSHLGFRCASGGSV